MSEGVNLIYTVSLEGNLSNVVLRAEVLGTGLLPSTAGKAHGIEGWQLEEKSGD